MSTETRNHMEPLSFRAEGKSLVATGYAAKFNRLSQNLGGFVEQIAPGTFKKTVQEADVRALFNHDPNMLLGRNKSGTLRMEEDDTGLSYEIDLPDTQLGRDVAVLLERGDISGSSFGFRMIEDEWSETEDGFPLRTLRSVALVDVSPVTYPAYTDTDAAMRSLAEHRSIGLDLVKAAAADNNLHDLLVAHRALEETKSDEAEEEASEDRTKSILAQPRFRHLI